LSRHRMLIPGICLCAAGFFLFSVFKSPRVTGSPHLTQRHIQYSFILRNQTNGLVSRLAAKLKGQDSVNTAENSFKWVAGNARYTGDSDINLWNGWMPGSGRLRNDDTR